MSKRVAITIAGAVSLGGPPPRPALSSEPAQTNPGGATSSVDDAYTVQRVSPGPSPPVEWR